MALSESDTTSVPDIVEYAAEDIAGDVTSSYVISTDDAAPFEFPQISSRPPADIVTVRGCDRFWNFWRSVSSMVMVIVSELCDMVSELTTSSVDASDIFMSSADTDMALSESDTTSVPDIVEYAAEDIAGDVTSSYVM